MQLVGLCYRSFQASKPPMDGCGWRLWFVEAKGLSEVECCFDDGGVMVAEVNWCWTRHEHNSVMLTIDVIAIIAIGVDWYAPIRECSVPTRWYDPTWSCTLTSCAKIICAFTLMARHLLRDDEV